jgi:magnesium-transporting ATPase (P-type)
MEQEIKKSESNSKNFWQFTIASMIFVSLVLMGSILVILLQGGHSISGKEAIRDAAFPLVLFVPIWIAIAMREEKPTPRQEKIIKIMIVVAVLLLMFNVLVFWLL